MVPLLEELGQAGRNDDLEQIVVYIATTVRTIEGLMGRDVPWSTIEAATGIDEAALRRLKHQLETGGDRTSHPAAT